MRDSKWTPIRNPHRCSQNQYKDALNKTLIAPALSSSTPTDCKFNLFVFGILPVFLPIVILDIQILPWLYGMVMLCHVKTEYILGIRKQCKKDCFKYQHHRDTDNKPVARNNALRCQKTHFTWGTRLLVEQSIFLLVNILVHSTQSNYTSIFHQKNIH